MQARLSDEQILEMDCLRLTQEGDEYAIASSSVIEFARAIESATASPSAAPADNLPLPGKWEGNGAGALNDKKGG